MTDLAVIETHPIQYHAPVYRELQSHFGINVTAIYGSDFSVAGYKDAEFGTTFAWDTDLLAGHSQHFLSRSQTGGARNAESVSTRGLHHVLEQLQPRVVLLTGYSPSFYRHSYRIAKRHGAPLIFRAETTDHAVERGRIKGAVRDIALKRLYHDCDALLYVGERSRQHYERLGMAADRLIFSPYCVDTSVFRTTDADRNELRDAKRAELDIGEHDFVILFSGKLVPRKDPMRLIEAARLLAGNARPVIIFLGAGELKEELRHAASIEPPVAVRFAGFKNQRAISAYYHAADCLVLPSVRGETWGLVVNEALAHGLPCIVSDGVGCAPDLIREGVTGAVFEAGNAADLAVALRSMLPLLKDMAVRTQCRELVDDYSVSNAARGIAAAVERAQQRG